MTSTPVTAALCNINGVNVGGDTVSVGDEYACLVETTFGCQQMIAGVTIDKITSPYPVYNLSEATDDIMEHAKKTRKW